MNSTSGNKLYDCTSKEIKVQIGTNDQMYTITLDNHSTPEEIAFAFCKQHKVNCSHIPEIVNTISAFLNKKVQTKRLFSIEEFIKRLKEKEIRSKRERKEKNEKENFDKEMEMRSSLRKKQIDPFTITTNERKLEHFLTNRNQVIDSMFSKYNMIFPMKSKELSLIDKSEYFMNMEKSEREKNRSFKSEGVCNKNKKPMKIMRSDRKTIGYVQIYFQRKLLVMNDLLHKK